MNLPNYLYKPESSNKALKNARGSGYLNGICYCMPGNKLCHDYKKCFGECLAFSGHLAMPVQQKALKQRSELFKSDIVRFVEMLESDICAHIRKADKLNLKASFRLNGTSDIDTQSLGIIEKYKDVQFYDYSKNFNQYSKHSNYYLCYSFNGENWGECLKKLRDGFNIAMVFDKVPETWKGFKVIDGDSCDLRFLDPKGVVIGLKPKGKLRKAKGIKA